MRSERMKKMLARAKANRNHQPYVVVKGNKRLMADPHPHQEETSQINQNASTSPSSSPQTPPKEEPQQSLKKLLIIANKKMEEAIARTNNNPKWILDEQQVRRQLEEVERRACSRPLFEDNSTLMPDFYKLFCKYS